MINTNTPAKNESHLANALGILDVIEYFLECLAEDKPIIWQDHTATADPPPPKKPRGIY